MNLLSLVTPWLDNVCQIKTKCYSTKTKKFCELPKYHPAREKKKPGQHDLRRARAWAWQPNAFPCRVLSSLGQTLQSQDKDPNTPNPRQPGRAESALPRGRGEQGRKGGTCLLSAHCALQVFLNSQTTGVAPSRLCSPLRSPHDSNLFLPF